MGTIFSFPRNFICALTHSIDIICALTHPIDIICDHHIPLILFATLHIPLILFAIITFHSLRKKRYPCPYACRCAHFFNVVFPALELVFLPSLLRACSLGRRRQRMRPAVLLDPLPLAVRVCFGRAIFIVTRFLGALPAR